MFDAVVAGAGPAGCAAAVGLARAGAKVALLVRKGSYGLKPGEIIDPTIRVTLAELGLENVFTEENSLALPGNVSIWSDDEPVEANGMKSPHGLGILVDRLAFEGVLQSAAQRLGVRIVSVAGEVRSTKTRKIWSVEYGRTTENIAAPILIQATGRGKGLVGRRQIMRMDGLVALLMYGRRSTAQMDQRLFIEAGTNGWWYAASLPDHQAVVAYMTDADLLPLGRDQKIKDFHRHLEATVLIAPFAGRLEETQPIVGFPSHSGISEDLHGPGWVKVGDAAATYDPLLGRGVPLAMAKGASIARLICASTDAAAAFDAYARAERLAFTTYRTDYMAVYARAAERFNSEFWKRRRPCAVCQ
jgi:flavin-dependent dehydrogenase